MTYVIVQVECTECKKYSGTMVSAEGHEKQLKCHYCSGELEVKEKVLTIGR